MLIFLMVMFIVLGVFTLLDGEPICLVFIISAILCGVIGYGGDEAKPEDLAEIGKMVEAYPELRPLVIEFNEDKEITNGEYYNIKAKYDALELQKQKEKLIPALVPDTQPSSQ